MSDIVDRLRNAGDDWPACLVVLEMEAADEIERLRAALKIANDNHEKFEREWYLRGDEIERLRGVISAAVSVPRYEPYGDYDNSYRLDLEEGGRYVKFDDLLAALHPAPIQKEEK